MRLPFPERISVRTLFYFAALLCVLQLLQGTNSTFALCSFFYIIVSGLAFNAAGGLTQTSGSYVFFYAVLGGILGLCLKAYLGEAADSNLESPLLTMYVYLASVCMMFVAVYLSRKVRLRHALLGDILPDYKMQVATIGCTVVAFLIVFIELLAPGGAGSVLSVLNQINHFFPLAIIFGVIHTIRRTGGRRSVNLPVLLCAFFMFFTGLIGFSKEGMFGPLACYLLAASSQRYRLNRIQIAGGILTVVFVFRYLVPFSQYGRIFKQDSAVVNMSTAFALLSNLEQVRQDYLASAALSHEDQLYGYFNTPQGFFDRLQMISIDDALIDHTANFGTYGWVPVVMSFENIVPHFIWKDKPTMGLGNTFAHEISLIGEEDESTGISFSATASAYHIGGWKGVFFLLPALWFILFWVYDSLCGDVRTVPWGLVLLIAYSHAAPEGDISSVIYMFSTGAFGVVVSSVAAAYLMPIVGTLFIGPEGVFLKRRAPVRSIPRRSTPGRLLPARSSEI